MAAALDERGLLLRSRAQAGPQAWRRADLRPHPRQRPLPLRADHLRRRQGPLRLQKLDHRQGDRAGQHRRTGAVAGPRVSGRRRSTVGPGGREPGRPLPDLRDAAAAAGEREGEPASIIPKATPCITVSRSSIWPATTALRRGVPAGGPLARRRQGDRSRTTTWPPAWRPWPSISRRGRPGSSRITWRARTCWTARLGVRARRRLEASEDYEELKLLARCDRKGRQRGVETSDWTKRSSIFASWRNVRGMRGYKGFRDWGFRDFDSAGALSTKEHGRQGRPLPQPRKGRKSIAQGVSPGGDSNNIDAKPRRGETKCDVEFLRRHKVE